MDYLMKAIQSIVWAISILILAGCGQPLNVTTENPVLIRTVPGGDSDRGRQVLHSYGCGACHVIPGVIGANAYVGPPLTAFAERHYIAGAVTNTPTNLVGWLQNPQSIEPETAMPNLAVTETDARDMAAYLYTLDDDWFFAD